MRPGKPSGIETQGEDETSGTGGKQFLSEPPSEVRVGVK